jgi:formylglycine-generating enzyme required for sulfatase activity
MKVTLPILLSIAAHATFAAGPEYEYRDIGISKQWKQCEATPAQAASWARIALRNEAHDRCEALGKGWTFDAVIDGGLVSTPECKNSPGQYFGKIDVAFARCKIMKKAPPKADKPEADKGGKAGDERAGKETAKKTSGSETTENKGDKADKKADNDKTKKKAEVDKPNKRAEGDKTPRDEGKKSESKKSGGNAIDDAFAKFEKDTGKSTAGKGSGIDAGFAKMEKERAEKAKRDEEATKKPVATETKREKESPAKKLTAGTVFKDCDECPEMVVLPPEAGNIAMGRTEVTQAQWKAVMRVNPSNFIKCGDDCPVDRVTWTEAKEYVRRLSLATRNTYRLPIDAEWVMACLAGNSKECDKDAPEDYVTNNWWEAAGVEKLNRNSNRVGRKNPNAWGLYDMRRSVWEWVEDCGRTQNELCKERISRYAAGQYGKSSDSPDHRSDSIGLRVVRDIP